MLSETHPTDVPGNYLKKHWYNNKKCMYINKKYLIDSKYIRIKKNSSKSKREKETENEEKQIRCAGLKCILNALETINSEAQL